MNQPRTMFRKIFIIGFIILIVIKSSAQQRSDGSFLFKLWFFIEKPNIEYDSTVKEVFQNFDVKGYPLFFFFMNNVSINTDTLLSKGFNNTYYFLSVSPSKNISFKDSAREALKKISKGNASFYLLIPSNCNQYVLCINNSTGQSFRLNGFEGNDFFAFLDDVKRTYYFDYHKQLSNSEFFNKFIVNGLDFKCIYNGLTMKGANLQKYPCLNKCASQTGLYYQEPWH